MYQDPKANELYLRWLQFATFSPIFRTHCQLEPIPVGNICDPHTNPHCQGCERRIWKFVSTPSGVALPPGGVVDLNNH